MERSTIRIRKRILLAFLFCVFSVAVFGIISLQVHQEIGTKLRLVEVADDLMDNILETRRFEKNYFLYHEPTSIHEAEYYISSVEGLYSAYGDAISDRDESHSGESFRDALENYKVTLEKIKSLSFEASQENTPLGISSLEGRLRSFGQVMLDIAHQWRKEEREQIGRLFKKTIQLFAASMGVFLILGVAVAFHLSQILVYPLIKLEAAMTRIAQGDFSFIPEDDLRSEEFRAVFTTFNRMIRELEDRQEQLVQSRKIAAIGTLTSGVAHELNNPINNIVLTTEAIKEDFHEMKEEDIHEMLQDILIQSERASEIVKNLLDFARAEKPELESIEINSLIKDTARLVRNQLAFSRVRFITEIPEDLPPTYGEAKSLQQVFLNLIINAFQAMPEGGDLTVHAASSADGESVMVDVSDTGAGIDARDFPNIFDPFYTTKEVGKGTGLGLSVSYNIVRKHGGRLEVKSKKGEGSTFTVILPTNVCRIKSASS